MNDANTDWDEIKEQLEELSEREGKTVTEFVESLYNEEGDDEAEDGDSAERGGNKARGDSDAPDSPDSTTATGGYDETTLVEDSDKPG